MKKYVITGATGAGKTQLIRYLADQGYSTISETARDLIAKGFSPKHVALFQRMVMQAQAQKESELGDNDTVFLDRSVIDGLAYYWFHGLEPALELQELAQEMHYDKIFLLELPKSNKSPEEEKDAKKIQELLITAYQSLGYKLIRVPVMSIKERAEFVKSKIPNLAFPKLMFN